MTLQELSFVTEDQRDSQWEDRFLQALAEGQVSVMSPDPVEGPDGWPYLAVTTEVESSSAEDTQKVIRWLSTRGMGLAVNLHKPYPDFVLNYGMLWYFCESGKFIQRDAMVSQASVQKNHEKVEYSMQNLAHAGTPTEQYLPTYVRGILKDFFRDQSIFMPKTLLLSQDKIRYDLAFSAESLGSPKESEWAGIGEAISWFLPPHYSVLMISEKELPPFADL